MAANVSRAARDENRLDVRHGRYLFSTYKSRPR